MSSAIRISFGPVIPFNPQFGYEFRAESRKGVEMRTGTNPDTGEPLDAQGCIRLAQTFFKSDPDEQDCPGCVNCGPPIAVTADEGCGGEEQMIPIGFVNAVLIDVRDYEGVNGDRSLIAEIKRRLLAYCPTDVVADTADDYKAGRDAGAEAAAQRCEKSGYVNGDLHARLIRRDVK